MAAGVCSIALGGVFGVIATFAMGMRVMTDFGLLFGAFAGFACSPALAFALRYGPWFPGVVWIALSTAIAAFIGGILTPPNDGPFLSMAISISVYVLASLQRGAIGWRRYRQPPAGMCESCGYNLAGLAPGVPCPECGVSTAKQSES